MVQRIGSKFEGGITLIDTRCEKEYLEKINAPVTGYVCKNGSFEKNMLENLEDVHIVDAIHANIVNKVYSVNIDGSEISQLLDFLN